MINEIKIILWSALVGGVLTGGLTFVFTWLLQKLQERRILKQKKIYFTQAIIDDLNTSVDLYEKVKDGWNKSKTIWFDYTIELKERRQIYQKNQEWILLYPSDIRKEISDYYIKTGKLIFLLEALQNQNYYLFNEYQNTVHSIKLNKSGITDEDAQKEALACLSHKNSNVENINRAIENNVGELKTFAQNAKSLVDKLNAFLR